MSCVERRTARGYESCDRVGAMRMETRRKRASVLLRLLHVVPTRSASELWEWRMCFWIMRIAGLVAR